MAGWVLWVILACALGVGEVLSGGFLLAPFALGAAAAAAADAIAARAAGIVVFVVASLLTLLLVPPRRVQAHPHRTGAAHRRRRAHRQAGHRARAHRQQGGGGHRPIEGEVWSARSLYDDQEIEPGARVEVVDITGASALVSE